MSQLPQGWELKTFGDVLSLVTNGVNGKQNKEGVGVPVSRIETIADQKIDLNRIGYLESYDEEKIEKYRLQENDILFSHINSALHLGKTAIVPSNVNLYHGVNLLRLAVNELAEPRYFNYYCKYFRLLGEFSAHAQHAVNQSSLNQKKLKAFNIPLAPIQQQKSITDKLDSVLAKVEAAQARLDKIPTTLKRFRQSVLAAATSGELTKDWREENNVVWEPSQSLLGDITEVTGGLTKNSKRGTFPLLKPYLRVANVYENRIVLDEVKEIGVKEKELSRVTVNHNDLLVVEGNGSIDQIGRVAIWKSQLEECVHQNHLIKVRSNPEVINPDFLLYFLMSPIGKQMIREKATSGAGLYTLSISKVSSIEVHFPNVAEQLKIVAVIEELFEHANTVEKQYNAAKARLDKLTQSILAKAFRGELITS
ncbi:restriction endonuclease subunit S [Glaciecola sp. 1036]|uniref:restriction endonuclease subunit S n=1 Tax=Alteromonadaceae TaxID=72275 RepID=UPI003D054FC9